MPVTHIILKNALVIHCSGGFCVLLTSLSLESEVPLKCQLNWS